MNFHHRCFPILALSTIFLISIFPASILAQQPYIGRDTTDCNNAHNSTSGLGYTCNGLRTSCQAYLTFRAQPPYTSVAAISTLLSVNSTQLSQLNSVTENSSFETDRIVLVPVTCSCSGPYYQVNASYVVRSGDTGYLRIANNTFQGLSTCQAMADQNSISTNSLNIGDRVTVPLRCACPTRNQTDAGVNYLLSYLLTWNQFLSTVSTLFQVDEASILFANQLNGTEIINPITTLLVPLRDPPTISQVTQPQSPPPPFGTELPTPAPPPGGGSDRTWVYIVVGVVGGLVLISIAGGILYFVVLRKRSPEKPEPAAPSRSYEAVKKDKDEESQDFLESLSSIAQSLKVYPFQELKSATQDFSPGSCIKGSVYRATINGDLAAVKKIHGDVSREITLLNKINHFNLIRLSGVSFNEGYWYLVYEYASNGSLGDWIRDGGGETILDWNKRLQIALDVAAGINYLHRYTTPPHIHKDLNCSNVLLDRDFRAKITNFNLARSAEGQEGEYALTRHIVGTKGYMAPEYLENGVVSPKLDVYAFGALLLEILTGKEVSVLCEEANTQQLPEVLIPVLHQDNGQGNLVNIMDPSLQGKYPPDLALVLFRLIDNCLKKEPSDRPNMEDIFQSLSRISDSSLSGEWSISISEQRTTPR